LLLPHHLHTTPPGFLPSGSPRLRPSHRTPPTARPPLPLFRAIRSVPSLPSHPGQSANYRSGQTYTVTEATTLTITECPCTQTKTYPATVSTIIISYLTTVRFLISSSESTANPLSVLPATHYDHLLGDHLRCDFTRYRHHLGRPVHLVHYLPGHLWHLCSSSYLYFLLTEHPRGNRQCSNCHRLLQRHQDTSVSFSDHILPSPGLCRCSHQG
jgi:hypothetical protein